MNLSDFLAKMSTIQKAYSLMCEKLLIKYNLPRTAFDIIMFLANNKEYYTANAISEIKNIKPNVVSIHVEKLAQEGYLERQAYEGDRRKVKLVCTSQCDPIIADGKKIQQEFFKKMLEGLTEDELESFKLCLVKIADNANAII